MSTTSELGHLAMPRPEMRRHTSLITYIFQYPLIAGKGPNVWDEYSRKNNLPTAKLACDSYHRYKEDVRMLKELGVSSRRLITFLSCCCCLHYSEEDMGLIYSRTRIKRTCI